MENLTGLLQVIVALSVVYVWTFRFHNVLTEFKQFGLSDVTRNMVGNSKIVLATLLVVGAWYPALVLISAVLMGVFMISAQYFHFKVNSPFSKRLPSLLLLLLCGFIAYSSL